MKKYLISPLLLQALLFVYIANNSFAQTKSKRITAIEATFPVIDKIFQEYAQKNHFPGFAFGLVVDGKLVHTASLGYTNLDNKTAVTTQSEIGRAHV